MVVVHKDIGSYCPCTTYRVCFIVTLCLPKHAMHTPPSPRARGPPQVRNFPSGAQAAVSERAPTTPAVTAAALSTNGPPRRINGAIISPTVPVCPG